jgi:hypothetical protein
VTDCRFVQKCIDEWPHYRQCFVERLSQRQERALCFALIPRLPKFTVRHIETVWQNDSSPRRFRLQGRSLNFGVERSLRNDGDEVDEVLETGRWTVSVPLDDCHHFVGHMIYERVDPITVLHDVGHHDTG